VKSHSYVLVPAPVDASVNATVRGAIPEVVLAEKAATGAAGGSVTVI